MKSNALSTVFSVLGWIAIAAAVIVLYTYLFTDFPQERLILAVSLVFSGLLLLAIAEVIKLLTNIEYNTRKEVKEEIEVPIKEDGIKDLISKISH